MSDIEWNVIGSKGRVTLLMPIYNVFGLLDAIPTTPLDASQHVTGPGCKVGTNQGRGSAEVRKLIKNDFQHPCTTHHITIHEA